MGRNPQDLTGELEAVEGRLRDGRPLATADTLDRIKRRAIAQASVGEAAWAPRKGLFMKPRIAVVFVLSLGLLMSGTGATLAVISDSGDASRVQYPDLDEKGAQDEIGDVLGSEETGGGDEGGSGGGGGGGDDAVAIQEERQVATSGGGADLPFTGFLAIPLLIVGVLLLVAGGVMRGRTQPDDR